ncbi:hypothetical protein HDU78_000834, partial [Chytriomyces hyalinus]
EKHLASLRKHYAMKKNHPSPITPLIRTLRANRNLFRQLLGPSTLQILAANLDKIAAFDTESDGVGAKHTLQLTREYLFVNLSTSVNDSLHLVRDDPTYNHENARKQIIQYVLGLEVIFAYQKQNVDSNRLKSLLGNDIFATNIAPKVIDFQ